MMQTSGEAIVGASKSKEYRKWWSKEVAGEWSRGVFVLERGEVRGKRDKIMF